GGGLDALVLPDLDLFLLGGLLFLAALGDLGLVQRGAGRPGGRRRRRRLRLGRLLLGGLGRSPLALLLFRELGRLARRELLLTGALLLAQLGLAGIERGRGRLDRDRPGVGQVALDEHALLLDLDLDGARLAARVGALDDLGGLLARERDLVLGLGGAVDLAQVLEELGLVLLRQHVLG